MSRSSAELLVIIHQDQYHLGRLHPYFEHRRFLIHQIHAPSTDFDSLLSHKFGGIVVLGGDMGAHDNDTYPFLREEIAFLRAAHGAEIPILGICLGGQLVTRALGGVVRARTGREVGWHTVRVLPNASLLGPAGMRSKFLWHRDTFELPLGAEPLAFTRTCLQAFRLGNTYAVQFHPEMTPHQISELTKGNSARLLGVDAADAEEIVQRTLAEDMNYEAAAARLVDGFCDRWLVAPRRFRTGTGIADESGMRWRRPWGTESRRNPMDTRGVQASSLSTGNGASS